MGQVRLGVVVVKVMPCRLLSLHHSPIKQGIDVHLCLCISGVGAQHGMTISPPSDSLFDMFSEEDKDHIFACPKL